MADANKFVDNNGFNNCIIISEGDVNITGKPDYLYERTAIESASMFVYTNGNLNITGGDSADRLNLVAYAKESIMIDFQPRIKGQLISEGDVSFLAITGRDKLTVYYDPSSVAGFYDDLSSGIGGIIDETYVNIISYGSPIVNTTEIPYVNVGRFREFSN
jgi:hypothetical protein